MGMDVFLFPLGPKTSLRMEKARAIVARDVVDPSNLWNMLRQLARTKRLWEDGCQPLHPARCRLSYSMAVEMLMFYYYGRKKQIAGRYPKSAFDVIVEPFAGAASYAMHGDNWRKNVYIIEKDKRVAAIWRWLIETATPAEILKLPKLKIGENSSEFIHIIHAATKMAFAYKTIKVTPVLERNWEISIRVMAENVYKVKHWTLIEGDYTTSPDIEATWFIDPPYRYRAGQGYAHGSGAIDYPSLAKWAMKRRGQLICCEGSTGDYLPFEPLLDLPGVAGKLSKEAMYHRPSAKLDSRDLSNLNKIIAAQPSVSLRIGGTLKDKEARRA